MVQQSSVHMSRSHFEQLVEGEMTKIKDAVMVTDPSNGYAIAKLQGKNDGLIVALKVYREAARIDNEEPL